MPQFVGMNRQILIAAFVLFLGVGSAPSVEAQTARPQNRMRSFGGGGGFPLVGQRPSVSASRAATLPSFGIGGGGTGASSLNRSVQRAGGRGFGSTGGNPPVQGRQRTVTVGPADPGDPPERLQGFQEDGTTRGGANPITGLW